jgi:hypothetical protein
MYFFVDHKAQSLILYLDDNVGLHLTEQRDKNDAKFQSVIMIGCVLSFVVNITKYRV